MRHGEAVGEAPGLGDAGRFLTEKGRKITRRTARWLAKKPKRCPAVIWTSPLVRAVQTAEILAEVAGAGVQVVAELSPGRDPKDLVALLRAETHKGPLALVGHEPSLSLLAAALLGASTLAGFKKSGVVALSFEGVGEEPASLVFAFDPKTQTAHKTIASLREPPVEE